MKSVFLCLAWAAFAPSIAVAEAPTVHLRYETYAAGLNVAEVDARLGLGPRSYQVALAFHTTGLTGVFVHGEQNDVVSGGWNGVAAEPSTYYGVGHWRGELRTARIAYEEGAPVIRELTPPNAGERESVPETLRKNTIDTVSALAQLIRTVEKTGRCDTTMMTFDGRRAVEVKAVTVGEETLPPNARSIYEGRALRCDFTGRLVAGFKLDDDRVKAAQPLHGTAWLADLGLGGARLPVRITFQMRWGGEATLYLTAAGGGVSAAPANRVP